MTVDYMGDRIYKLYWWGRGVQSQIHVENGENSKINAQVITSSALQEQSHLIRDDLFIV